MDRVGHGSDVAARLEATAQVWVALHQRRFDAAFAGYLDAYQLCSRRSAIEWRLAEAVVIAGAADARWVDALPADALTRPSGAALAFVVAQYSGAHVRSLGALAALPRVSSSGKRVLARAWHRMPTTRCLADRGFRERFACWLAEEADAVGTVVVAAARSGDLDLAREFADRWLFTALDPAEAPSLTSELARVPELADLVREALRALLGLVHGDLDAPGCLLDAACAIEDLDCALTVSALLLERELPPAQRRAVLARRIRALADAAQHVAAAAEYRTRWMPEARDESYPWPERLLESLQRECDEEAEKHLLVTSVCDHADAPELELTRTALERRAPTTTRDEMRVWQTLLLAVT